MEKSDQKKVEKEAIKHITVKIAESVHRKLRIKAATDGLHMNKLLEKMILEYMK
jgi:predicted HicB family RNase H-like nuclease